MKKLGIIFLFAIAVLALNFADADIIINEIMPHTNNTLGNEWVELYNNGTENATIINWALWDSISSPSSRNFSINISSGEYGLIVEESINCSNLNLTNASCIQLDWLGSKLNDGGDSAILYDNNNTIISNFSWNSDIKTSGKSFSYNGSNWRTCAPTPGRENNCTIIAQICNVSYSCGDWGSCSSSGTRTRTCANITADCISASITESQSCTYTSSSSGSIYLELDWDDGQIINVYEFKIKVKAFNLADKDYDLKVWIENEDGKIISERYGKYGSDNEEVWKSGNYYAIESISGSGDQTENIRIKIKDTQKDFNGTAELKVKIRETDSQTEKASASEDIEILAKNISSDNSRDSSSISPATSVSSGITGSVINLAGSNIEQNNQALENSIIYKSKNEYIKEYAPYVFCAICLCALAVFLVKRSRIIKKWIK